MTVIGRTNYQPKRLVQEDLVKWLEIWRHRTPTERLRFLQPPEQAFPSSNQSHPRPLLRVVQSRSKQPRTIR